MDPGKCRTLFPVTKDYAFFNHAATSALSLPVVEAMEAHLRESSSRASLGYRLWTQRLETVRQQAARLLGASCDEVAFTGNTSTGLAIAAEGFDWREGDEVLVPMPDFPANVYPWQHLQRRGVVVKEVRRRAGRLEVEDFAAALSEKSRMLVVSSVDYASGFAVDLAALGGFCREKGLIFGVDAIQSLGVLPLDVKACGIHFLAAGGHKWLLGPMGTGLFYLDAGVAELFVPPLVGWRSVVDEEDFELHFRLKSDARRFENGTLDLAGIFGLGAALELLEKVGGEAVWQRVQALNVQIEGQLRERSLEGTEWRGAERSGILTFRVPGDAERCFRHLLSRKVVLSLRQGRMRLAPHFYNDEADIAVLLAALDDYLATC